jgi:hypothetical protein
MHIKRVEFLDINFDRLTLEGVKGRLEAVTASSRYSYIITPNVDRVERFHRKPRLRDANRNLVSLACLRGIRRQLVAGSELTPVLFARTIKPFAKVVVSSLAAVPVSSDGSEIHSLLSNSFIRRRPVSVPSNAAARGLAMELIAASNVRFAFLAMGSPQ